MSDVNDTVGGGEMVEALGQAWTLSHVGPGIRAAFSRWVKLRARQELAGLKGDLDPDDYAEALASLNEQAATGAYNWGTPLNPKGMGSAVRAAMRAEDGQAYLMGLLLEKAHGKLPPDRVAEVLGGADADLIGQALKACLGLGVPNAPAPEKPKG